MYYKHSVQHFAASSIIFNFLLFNKYTMKVRLILYLTQLPKDWPSNSVIINLLTHCYKQKLICYNKFLID